MFSISKVARALLHAPLLAASGLAAAGAEDCRKLFALTGTDVSITTARMAPAAGDTHLFVNGSADDATMQKLLAMGARTCYLHATLGAAIAPVFAFSGSSQRT